MSTQALDLNLTAQNLIKEYDELVQAESELRHQIEILQKRFAALEKEIHDLPSFEGEEEQETNYETLSTEQAAVDQALISKIAELRRITDKIQYSRLQIQSLRMGAEFHLSVMEVWEKESHYRRLLEESGMTTKQALLQEQGYKLPPEYDDASNNDDDDEQNKYHGAHEIYLIDYMRMGRQDIVDLLNGLSDPAKRKSIFEKAKAEYEKTSDYNYGLILAFCYKRGFGTEANEDAAFAIHTQGVSESHPLALMFYAIAALSGSFIEQDQKKAIEYYERATAADQQSFYFPHFMWGHCLWDGEEVEQDEERAVQLFKIAAEKGFRIAAELLVTYYVKRCYGLQNTVNNDDNPDPGAGTAAAAAAATPATTAHTAAPPTPSQSDINAVRAQMYFYASRANELGSSFGKFYLSICYYYGWGVAKDEQRHFELLLQCKTLGCVSAINLLAEHYQDGIEGLLQPDPIQSLQLYFECFRRNYINKLEEFKTLIHDHLSQPEFMAVAYDLCKKCLQGHLLNNPLDSSVIGLFYLHGILLPKDLEKAIICLRKAADAGLEVAATAFVKLSNSGHITISEARKYFQYADYDDEEVDAADENYYFSFMPLFDQIKETWTKLGLDAALNESDNVPRLIAEYAVTTVKEEESSCQAAGSAASAAAAADPTVAPTAAAAHREQCTIT